MIASSSNDQTIKIWQQDKDEASLTLHGHEHVIEIVRFAKGQCKLSIHDAKWNKETAILNKASKEKNLDDIIKESKDRLKNPDQNPESNGEEAKSNLDY